VSARTPRAAIVTGASSGIGLAIATMLAEEGYALTIASRREAKLNAAAELLAGLGGSVQPVVTDVSSEQAIEELVGRHRERFGRLDVLVNNAGMGIVSPIGEQSTKHVDLQLRVNLRAMILMFRASLDLLKQAGTEHGNALAVFTSSITGKAGAESLSVYSATKHGIVGFTQAMNRELRTMGVKSCALCPGLVDTSLSDYAKHDVPAENMIRASDLAQMVRALLQLSPQCVIPEIIFTGPGDMVLY
jgi:NAD(P)-dependent dehydrogenase (short-subunit alcohol dehydrogenase family)